MIENRDEKKADVHEDKVDVHVGLADELTAYIANQEDHELSAGQSLRANPWPVLWCMYAMWLLLLESYENIASGSILGIPQFRKDFGYPFNGDYVLPASWQSAFSGGPTAAAVSGALCTGYVSDKIGRKLAFAIAIILSIIGITLETTATTNPVFFVGKLISGFSCGIFLQNSMTYIGEISPTPLRGVLTAASSIAFGIGPLIATLIVTYTGTYTNRWAYRAVFVSQYGVLAIGILGWPFMPESPWWLVESGKEEKATQALKRLGYSESATSKRIAAIIFTLEEVRRETEGVTYLECFRKSNLRRTIISIAPLVIQALCGITFINSYSTYYFQLAGYSPHASFVLSIGQQVISIVGNFVAWFLIDRAGRRSLLVYGLLHLIVVLFITGGLAVKGTPGALKGTVALILYYVFAYAVTIGAVGNTIVTEVATSRLRGKTIAIGLACQFSLYTMWGFVLPYLFNPDKANLGARVSFIFGGLAILSFVFLWFNHPETAYRTYEELDEMFVNKISARKFKTTVTETEIKGRQAKNIAQ